MHYLTFIPWIVYFPILSYIAYHELYSQKKLTGKAWAKENILKAIRFDNLLLLLVFIYFIQFKNYTVNIMLFGMINLYLLVKSLYEIPKDKQKFKGKEKMFALITQIIFISSPIIYYLITKNIVITWLIMFCYNFLAYLLVIITNNLMIHLINPKDVKKSSKKA